MARAVPTLRYRLVSHPVRKVLTVNTHKLLTNSYAKHRLLSPCTDPQFATNAREVAVPGNGKGPGKPASRGICLRTRVVAWSPMPEHLTVSGDCAGAPPPWSFKGLPNGPSV